ncbi:MAG: dihydroneopterin aldolase [Acidimicrobiia bacterium]|nr:dihydroneopterin aldolase [Acidimicrobiia bacterium]
MFERFTDRARRVVILAQENARLLNHDFIGTEHLLLGLIQEGEGVAAQGLLDLGVRLDSVRSEVAETVGQGRQAPSGYISFTPRAKKALELSLREALQLGHNYIGTGHILLGLIREGDGVAVQVLEKLVSDLPRVRQTIIRLLSEGAGNKEVSAAADPGDSITLRGLRVRAHHGVMEQERAGGQIFVVDVKACLDLSEAGTTDELPSTLDYGTLAEAIHQRVCGERWNLIERVAERVADLVLEDRRVVRVEVTVHKPEAPIGVEFEDVSVSVVRPIPGPELPPE